MSKSCIYSVVMFQNAQVRTLLGVKNVFAATEETAPRPYVFGAVSFFMRSIRLIQFLSGFLGRWRRFRCTLPARTHRKLTGRSKNSGTGGKFHIGAGSTPDGAAVSTSPPHRLTSESTPPAQISRPAHRRSGCRHTAPQSPACREGQTRGRTCPPAWWRDPG